MSTDQAINLLVTIALIELMAAIGLGVKPADVAVVVRDRQLMVQAAVANYVCVPAAAVGLLLWFHAPPMIAAGFMIAAVCPGAPYAPPFTAMARGNVAVAVGLMVVLAGSSAIVAPLLLRSTLPVVSGSQTLTIDATRMLLTLLLTQLLPLCAGLAVRVWRPQLADRMVKPANRLSVLLNLSAIGLIVGVHFRVLLAIRPVGYLGMLALVLTALAAGWLLGAPGEGNRKAMAVSTAVRNVGVGLVIAGGSFPGTPAVTATLAFGLFQTVVLALIALGWGRLAPSNPAFST